MACIVFLSHASKDREMADTFANFLQDGMGIPRSGVFFTSRAGVLVPGEDSVPAMKENLKDCRVAILLLTGEYFRRPFCVAELGAAWVLDKPIVPVIVPPLKVDILNQTPLMGVQASFVDNKDSLWALYERLSVMGVTDGATDFNRFNKEYEKYMGAMQAQGMLPHVLVKDRNGYYEATIVENRPQVGKKHWCYRLNGLVETGEPYAEGENHWLLYFSSEHASLQIGDRVRFTVKEVRPLDSFNDLENYRNLYLWDLQRRLEDGTYVSWTVEEAEKRMAGHV